jgi:hypothetical protein
MNSKVRNPLGTSRSEHRIRDLACARSPLASCHIRHSLFAILLGPCLAVGTAEAADTLDCAAVSMGGGVASNGSIGVVGQPAVGAMSNSLYRLDAGVVPGLIAGEEAPPPDDPPSGSVWMTFRSATTVPGVGTVDSADIVAYNLETGVWSWVFDGSDVGLGGLVIDGLARQPDGAILLSFDTAVRFPGLIGGPSGTLLDDSDIVRFTAASLGPATSGSFTFHFDGSDVGLLTESEDVDGIAITNDGTLVLSMLGLFSATGAFGRGEDLVSFTGVAGAETVGTLAMYFDGSDVGLSGAGEEVNAVSVSAWGAVYLSTSGPFSVTGASGQAGDVLEFVPSIVGERTIGEFSLRLRLSAMGINTFAAVGSLEFVD